MMHKTRAFRVSDVDRDGYMLTPFSLAHLLTQYDWTVCSAFRIEHLVFANDSTGPDGAQEYAVFDTDLGKQVESLTVSWMKGEKLEALIHQYLKKDYGVEPWGELPNFNHPEGYCARCA